MDARPVNPFLGLAIAVSIAAAAQAQYIPTGPIAIPQQMVVLPHPVPNSMPIMMGTPIGMQMPSAAHQVVPGRVIAAPMPSMRGSNIAAAQPHAKRGQSTAESENFIVFASDKAWAEEVAATAEQHRRELAEHWLGQTLPQWSGRCPIHVTDAPDLGAGGETRFIVQQGVAGNWMMSVQGTRERILDSVLPHEISHTIFATHFGRLNKYVPRWADEGAATTVEHEAEKSKHRYYLRKFLQTGRGLAFNKMFQLKEYPKDILPLYAQGHSAVQFLIDQSDPRHFIKFLELGMQTEDWTGALTKFYDYQTIGDFQTRWNKWLLDGSPGDLLAYAPKLNRQSGGSIALASANIKPAAAGMPNSVVSATLPNDPKSLELMPSYVKEEQLAGDSRNGTSAEPAHAANVQQDDSRAVVSLSEAIAMANPTAQATDTQVQLNASGESWYKRKLHQTSGQPATPIPQHNSFPGDNSLDPTGSKANSASALGSAPNSGRFSGNPAVDNSAVGTRPISSYSSSIMTNLRPIR